MTVSDHLPSVISLIGIMGSGKSTVGYHLAKHLGYTFVDTDRAIESDTGFRVRYLFALHGEAYFRDLEKTWCEKNLPLLKNTVVATGGGLIVDPQNQANLKRYTHIVWLNVPLDTLKKRFIVDDKRPLAHELDKRYEQRLPIYQRLATTHYDTTTVDRETHYSLAEKIKQDYADA